MTPDDYRQITALRNRPDVIGAMFHGHYIVTAERDEAEGFALLGLYGRDGSFIEYDQYSELTTDEALDAMALIRAGVYKIEEVFDFFVD